MEATKSVVRMSDGPIVHDPLAAYADVERARVGDRPWVMANMVAGLDGSTAVAGRVGDLSDDTDRALFKDLRALADIVLVGAGTVRAERYGPVRLKDDLVDWRVSHGRAPSPPIAVVSASLRLDDDLPLLTGDVRPIVLTGEASPVAERDRLARSADVVVAGDDVVHIETALRGLADRGADVVLCEGGPALLGELVAADALDELLLTLSPAMGGDALPVAVTPPGSSLVGFDLAHVLRAGDTLFLRYLRVRHG